MATTNNMNNIDPFDCVPVDSFEAQQNVNEGKKRMQKLHLQMLQHDKMHGGISFICDCHKRGLGQFLSKDQIVGQQFFANSTNRSFGAGNRNINNDLEGVSLQKQPSLSKSKGGTVKTSGKAGNEVITKKISKRKSAPGLFVLPDGKIGTAGSKMDSVDAQLMQRAMSINNSRGKLSFQRGGESSGAGQSDSGAGQQTLTRSTSYNSKQPGFATIFLRDSDASAAGTASNYEDRGRTTAIPNSAAFGKKSSESYSFQRAMSMPLRLPAEIFGNLNFDRTDSKSGQRAAGGATPTSPVVLDDIKLQTDDWTAAGVKQVQKIVLEKEDDSWKKLWLAEIGSVGGCPSPTGVQATQQEPVQIERPTTPYTLASSTMITKKPFSENKRQFKVVEIAENNVKVCLVSDPDTDVAAAAVCVDIGSYFSNFFGVHGMAHFLEHMLFMGTKKYPDEDSYDKFLSESGGFNNAYTTLEETCYHLEVQPEKLEEAVDRLAEFFLSPLIKPECVDREMKAVNSEHSGKIQKDGSRFSQVLKNECDPWHPFHAFTCGNLETLNIGGGAQNAGGSAGSKVSGRTDSENLKKGSIISAAKRRYSNAAHKGSNQYIYNSANPTEVAEKIKKLGLLSNITGDSTMAEVVTKFYDEYYSSHFMGVGVVGRESLEELEKMICHRFVKVKANKKYQKTKAEKEAKLDPDPMRNLMESMLNARTLVRNEDIVKAAAAGGSALTAKPNADYDKIDPATKSSKSWWNLPYGFNRYYSREDSKNLKQKWSNSNSVIFKGYTSPEAIIDIGQNGKNNNKSFQEFLSKLPEAEIQKSPIYPVLKQASNIMPSMTLIEPTKDIYHVSFQFFGPNMRDFWRLDIARFWGHMIGHESKGGIAEKLREEKLAVSLMAGEEMDDTTGASSFAVSLQLGEGDEDSDEEDEDEEWEDEDNQDGSDEPEESDVLEQEPEDGEDDGSSGVKKYRSRQKSVFEEEPAGEDDLKSEGGSSKPQGDPQQAAVKNFLMKKISEARDESGESQNNQNDPSASQRSSVVRKKSSSTEDKKEKRRGVVKKNSAEIYAKVLKIGSYIFEYIAMLKKEFITKKSKSVHTRQLKDIWQECDDLLELEFQFCTKKEPGDASIDFAVDILKNDQEPHELIYYEAQYNEEIYLEFLDKILVPENLRVEIAFKGCTQCVKENDILKEYVGVLKEEERVIRLDDAVLTTFFPTMVAENTKNLPDVLELPGRAEPPGGPPGHNCKLNTSLTDENNVKLNQIVQKEHYYGVVHTVPLFVPVEWKDCWIKTLNADFSEEKSGFHLPPPNKFVPKDFALVEVLDVDDKVLKNEKDPAKILDNIPEDPFRNTKIGDVVEKLDNGGVIKRCCFVPEFGEGTMNCGLAAKAKLQKETKNDEAAAAGAAEEIRKYSNPFLYLYQSPKAKYNVFFKHLVYPFEEPRIFLDFMFFTDWHWESFEKNQLLNLWCAMTMEKLNEEFYDAQSCDLEFQIRTNNNGVLFYCQGYSDKVLDLFESGLQNIFALESTIIGKQSPELTYEKFYQTSLLTVYDNLKTTAKTNHLTKKPGAQCNRQASVVLGVTNEGQWTQYYSLGEGRIVDNDLSYYWFEDREFVKLDFEKCLDSEGRAIKDETTDEYAKRCGKSDPSSPKKSSSKKVSEVSGKTSTMSDEAGRESGVSAVSGATGATGASSIVESEVDERSTVTGAMGATAAMAAAGKGGSKKPHVPKILVSIKDIKQAQSEIFGNVFFGEGCIGGNIRKSHVTRLGEICEKYVKISEKARDRRRYRNVLSSTKGCEFENGDTSGASGVRKVGKFANCGKPGESSPSSTISKPLIQKESYEGISQQQIELFGAEANLENCFLKCFSGNRRIVKDSKILSRTKNMNEPNSVVVMTIQIPDALDSYKYCTLERGVHNPATNPGGVDYGKFGSTRMFIDLYAEIAGQKYFHHLRTLQQLGYSVYISGGREGLSFSVNSADFEVVEIEKRIVEFFDKFLTDLKMTDYNAGTAATADGPSEGNKKSDESQFILQITEEEFESHCKGMVSNMKQKPQSSEELYHATCMGLAITNKRVFCGARANDRNESWYMQFLQDRNRCNLLEFKKFVEELKTLPKLWNIVAGPKNYESDATAKTREPSEEMKKVILKNADGRFLTDSEYLEVLDLNLTDEFYMGGTRRVYF